MVVHSCNGKLCSCKKKKKAGGGRTQDLHILMWSGLQSVFYFQEEKTGWNSIYIMLA